MTAGEPGLSANGARAAFIASVLGGEADQLAVTARLRHAWFEVVCTDDEGDSYTALVVKAAAGLVLVLGDDGQRYELPMRPEWAGMARQRETWQRPAQNPTAERIRAERAAGTSWLAIARILTEEGIPSPTGGVWTEADIRQVLNAATDPGESR